MELSVPASLLAAGAVSVALAVIHVFSGVLRRLPAPERAVGSFAGGISVAYVFLHLLPEIATGNQGVAEALDDVVTETPLVELALFAVALTGFAVMYALEHLGRRDGEARARTGGGRSSALLYRAHLGAFALYNVLITYSMPLRFRTGVLFALLFAVAMALHFLLTDRGLSEHYPDRFGRSSRLVLAGALVVGLLLAAAAAPTRTLTVSVLTALLGGAVLLNVFKEELPSSGRSSMPWFLVGLGVYGVLLAAVTAAEG
ncbi:hypothetical protein [Aquipuribacter sp. SD81]|uniref:hypothetical protein n=1 Tax=Aquipuribacter sp. SD81 TaxID=3127703 RepID=UPI003015A697